MQIAALTHVHMDVLFTCLKKGKCMGWDDRNSIWSH
jgi:hypothetical protein